MHQFEPVLYGNRIGPFPHSRNAGGLAAGIELDAYRLKRIG